MSEKKGKAPKEAAASVAAVVKARDDELRAARDQLGLFKTPLAVLRIFGGACAEFLVAAAKTYAASTAALVLVYPLVAAYLGTRTYMPELYAPPDCRGSAPGLLYMAELYVYEALWWLVLGILSSIGLGTGLHSGIMFLWPFCMKVILKTQECQSTAFSAMYNYECALECGPASDGSLTFFNTLLLLWPSVVLWGSGTAMGELPPYFITRAAKRAGSRATDFEDELEEAKVGTDIISKLKVWTISFTEKHGFLGILLLASWPNAAFDMCGMACGWLEVPFWTFFGATLLGKGFFKVTFQSAACIVVFSRPFWEGLLALAPPLSLPSAACAKAGVKEGVTCNLPAFLDAGRAKAMHKFSLQSRFLPSKLAGITEAKLVDEYCKVMSVCGEKAGGMLGSSGYADGAKASEMKTIAARAFAVLDTDSDGALSAAELIPVTGTSDGKLSLASLDPGDGSGGVLSLGALWGAFIAGLVLFFVYSIVEQVALSTQQGYDADELAALEAKLEAEAAAKPKPKAKAKKD